MYEVLIKYLPQHAYEPTVHLLKVHSPFKLIITHARKTKFGDYRYLPSEDQHIISINNDLNPFAFLVTLLHELAHLITYKKYKNKRIKPHGDEWKAEFQALLTSFLAYDIFPDDLTPFLLRYINNPKASSATDPKFYLALRKYDKNVSEVTVLGQLQIGDVFLLEKRQFKKLDNRRTKVLCEEISSKKRYLIAKIAEVKPISR